MNNYPVWWDTTLTIYNKFVDEATGIISWTKTVIPSCFWKYVGDKINVGNTILETNNTICRIPQNPNFMEKYLWIQLQPQARENYFTLGVGDLIVRGSVEDVIDEYQSGKRSTDLIKKYKALQGVIEIERVSLNIGIGRVSPHYYVKGI